MSLSDGVSSILADLLPGTTVRISVSGLGPTGTGFFVAPDTVLTCKHVLKPLDLSAEGVTEMIGVEGKGDAEGKDRRPYTVAQIRHVSDADDIAVLRVKPPHLQCALLEAGVTLEDSLHAFGYTERHPEGIPVGGLVVDGMTGDSRFFKLRGAQVQPGLSGAPVVNGRTGAVCGMLKSSIDPDQAIGGYAIPIAKVFALNEAISSANRTFHAGQSEWLDRLPAATRQVWLSGKASEPGTGPPERVMVLSVAQEQDCWSVTACVTPGDKKIGPVEVDLNPVRIEVARLFRDWASPDATWRGRVDRGEELRLLGKIFSRAVLPGEVGKAFEDLLGLRRDGWLQVALRFDDDTDPDLEYLPWEHLYLPPARDMTGIYVATEAGLAFTRTRLADVREEPAPPPRELSVLLVTVEPTENSSPDNAAAVRDVADEVQRILTGVKAALAGKRVKMAFAESPDAIGLMNRIDETQPDIVHYIGYGRFEHGRDEVALGRPGDRIDFVNAMTFANAVANAPPKVAVLQLCDAVDLVPVRGDLAPFAPNLLARGVEALVAYQYPTQWEQSICFNQHFYKKLTAGTTVEMAAQSARNAMAMKEPGSHGFLAPTVCVRQPGGVRLTAEDTESAPRSWVGPAGSYG